MITGELRNKVDRVWDAVWSGGITNPLEVIQQITYLLFIRRLDELQAKKERQARVEKRGVENPIFLRETDHLRWNRFKQLGNSDAMYKVVADEVFPFLRELGGDGSTYSIHMKDARLTIPTPSLLARAVDMLDDIPMENRDTNGDLYEYLLGKLANAGVSGQFRTPRHIINLMVTIIAPGPGDTICDPACGTAGFLVSASEYVRENHPSVLTDPGERDHFSHGMFHGYDIDPTMLRIGSMNMLMHGIDSPDIRYRDSLSEGASEDNSKYSLIFANPPFAGTLNYEETSKDLQKVVKTKKTELLFLALFLKLLKPGGRAAVIVPEGVLFGSSTAHKGLRKTLVEDQKLDAVIKLPSGVFRPYAGVSTAILIFTKTDSGGTEDVWFYDVRAEGFSLDDKRKKVEANDLPDVIMRWPLRATSERDRDRSQKSFVVPSTEIANQGYDLSFNRYRADLENLSSHRDPLEIIAEIEALEREASKALAEIRTALS